MTTNTVAKTYRLPTALHKLILIEVEKSGVSEADFVRNMLKQHFERRIEESRISLMEKQLTSVIERNSRDLSALIQQVISMAEPSTY